jgi:hypothetical protein
LMFSAAYQPARRSGKQGKTMLATSRCRGVKQSSDQIQTAGSLSYPSMFIDGLIAKVSIVAVQCAVISSCYNGLESAKTKVDLRSTLA